MALCLRFRESISRQAAEEMLHAFVACGENSERTWFWSPAQVKGLFGEEYDSIIERVQRGETIPQYENLLSATIEVSAPGSYIGLRLSPTGKEIHVPEAGVININEYVAKFEAAVEARDRAVGRHSVTEFDSSTYNGVASIEAFFNWQADAWDHVHPEDPIARKHSRMSLDEKIKIWLRTLATGSWLDYKSISWEAFFQLKRLRNSSTHARDSGSGITLQELALRINLFCHGLAVPFMQLHQVFHERIPSAIIRAAYSPEVYVAEDRGLGSGGADDERLRRG